MQFIFRRLFLLTLLMFTLNSVSANASKTWPKISGHILNMSGGPVQGAKVSIIVSDEDFPGVSFHKVVYETLTDADGYYEFEIPVSYYRASEGIFGFITKKLRRYAIIHFAPPKKSIDEDEAKDYSIVTSLADAKGLKNRQVGTYDYDLLQLNPGSQRTELLYLAEVEMRPQVELVPLSFSEIRHFKIFSTLQKNLGSQLVITNNGRSVLNEYSSNPWNNPVFFNPSEKKVYLLGTSPSHPLVKVRMILSNPGRVDFSLSQNTSGYYDRFSDVKTLLGLNIRIALQDILKSDLDWQFARASQLTTRIGQNNFLVAFGESSETPLLCRQLFRN